MTEILAEAPGSQCLNSEVGACGLEGIAASQGQSSQKEKNMRHLLPKLKLISIVFLENKLLIVLLPFPICLGFVLQSIKACHMIYTRKVVLQ